MTSAKQSGKHPSGDKDVADEMAKYGITRVSVTYFHYGDFRYTNLAEAIAQAKREQPAVRPVEPSRS